MNRILQNGRMEEKEFDLAGRIIGCAMRVHRTLGPGFLEAVYQRALVMELEEAGLQAEQQKGITVHYRGRPIGEFFADIVVNGDVIIENKAVNTLLNIHETQLVHDLTATGTDIGVLLNFGATRLEYKKKFRIYKPSPLSPQAIL